MPNKISDNDIKKALERYKNVDDNDITTTSFKTILLKEVYLLINRLEAKIVAEQNYSDCLNTEIDRLKQNLEEAHIDIREHLAENERLEKENKLLIDNDVSNKYPNCVLMEKGRIYTKTLEDYDNLIGDISAEAYKEFAERLKEISKYETYCDNRLPAPIITYHITKDNLDNLLKEMIGE